MLIRGACGQSTSQVAFKEPWRKFMQDLCRDNSIFGGCIKDPRVVLPVLHRLITETRLPTVPERHELSSAFPGLVNLLCANGLGLSNPLPQFFCTLLQQLALRCQLLEGTGPRLCPHVAAYCARRSPG